MINIATLILTRKCNLSCSYCRLCGDIDYILKPDDYPHSSYFYENEQPVEKWIELINKFHKHNPNIFLLLVGGEPFLYPQLTELVIYLNEKNINYTIISNCSNELKDIREKFFKRVGKVKGFTGSIDPGTLNVIDNIDDEIYKAQSGFRVLKDLIKRNLVEDPVAELVCDAYNYNHIEETVKILSENGIWSDITTIDISKNQYYDFSAVTNPKDLLPKNEEVKQIFDNLITSNYLIHMKETLLPKIYDILPANLDCDIDKLTNVTVGVDLNLRLCYRIFGRHSRKFSSMDLFTEKYDDIKNAFKADKSTLCKKCSWSCPLISESSSEDIIRH